jgi:hypothetical protein
MLDLTNHFGIDVEKRFLDWFHGEFAKEFAERFPEKKGISLVILDPDNIVKVVTEWGSPLENAILVSYLGDQEAHTKADGTLQNVVGKLRYVLRNGEETSLEAEEDDLWVRPGDFPWEGAGEHKGFYGGVSGLDKADDWAVYTQCIDKLIEILKPIGKKALERTEELRSSEDPPVGARYCNVTLTDEDVWPSPEENQVDSIDEVEEEETAADS